VRLEATNYDNQSMRNINWNGPEHAAFERHYKNYEPGPRDNVAGLMLFKAYMEGADAEKLRSALSKAFSDSWRLEMLPCLAVHANFNGRPAWIIVFNWGIGGESLSHIRYYIIDDATGETVYYMTCK